MNTQHQFEPATPADVQQIIRKAQSMRSAYFSKSITAGVTKLAGAFGRKKPAFTAPAQRLTSTPVDAVTAA